jgi:hypothetical protein
MYDTFGIYDNIVYLELIVLRVLVTAFETLFISSVDDVGYRAYLVENGRPLICGSELHSVVTQTLFRAFRTALITLSH